MMIIFKYIVATATLLAATIVAGCKNDSDQPSPEVPDTERTPNTTIAELKEAYWNDAANHISAVGPDVAGDHVVVSGRVISTDATANITHCLVIQDATAALTIRINADSLFTHYRTGQEVVVDVTDMYIGRYRGLQQLGVPDYSAGRGRYPAPMSYDFFTRHSYLRGSPDGTDLDTVTVTIPSLSSSPDVLRRLQSRLVRIDNVRFPEGGRTSFGITGESVTERILLDSGNNSLSVLTSGKATFAGEKLPEGIFDIVGILLYDDNGTDSAWQLMIRSTDDLLNLRTAPPVDPDNPDNPDDPGNGGHNPAIPDLPAGDGTVNSPYNVTQALEIYRKGGASAIYITGYIVGFIDDSDSDTGPRFSADSPSVFNILIASSPSERDVARCMVVQLPWGEVRSALNLASNPGNIGRRVTLRGDIGKYLGMPALRSTSAYSFGATND